MYNHLVVINCLSIDPLCYYYSLVLRINLNKLILISRSTDVVNRCVW